MLRNARIIIQEDRKMHMFACIYAKCITTSTTLQHKHVHDSQTRKQVTWRVNAERQIVHDSILIIAGTKEQSFQYSKTSKTRCKQF
jgi:hypothetical protein